MQYHDSVIDLIGGTPLVRLRSVTSGLEPLVLAKLESANPGGSAKDRIALRMIEAAEAAGHLRPGGTIVEPTSGNTGVGLALVAQQKGYRCVFTVPDKVSADKIAVLRAYGAEVVICPAARHPDHPESYRATSARLAEEIPGAFRPDQYHNLSNPASHYAATGPELWAQTDGRITHLVAGVGTGGTISGTGRFLKEVSGGRVRVIGADPDGSVYTGGGGRPYHVEGVGQPTFPGSFDPAVPDEILAVSDLDSVTVTRRLAREEGILTGGSGGMAVAAALRVAAQAGPGDVIVVVIPDSGRGYLSKIFDDGWVRRFGFEAEPGEGTRLGDVARELVTVDPQESIAGAIKVMRTTGLSHLPVSAAPPPVRLAEITGTVSEAGLAEGLATGSIQLTDPVAAHMTAQLPVAGCGQLASTAAALVTEHGAVLAVDGGLPAGLVTLRDLLALP
ncbi:cystathionine beta-synthase [Longispora albida]|uniref:cystathionine beta-synthase n=1 Tax=Longispora albida TaxID=203523 RepID=UPI000370DC9C|nr:cystathionine beta-synthase [Longispora albida]